MSRSTERLMRGRHLGRLLDRQFCNAISIADVFSFQIKIFNGQQPFRIQFCHRFNLTSKIDRRRTLIAQKQIHRDVRDNFDKQTIGDLNRCFRQRCAKLQQAAIDVAGSQLLITQSCVGNHDQFIRTRDCDRLWVRCDESLQNVNSLVDRQRQRQLDFFFFVIRVRRRIC